MFKGEVQSTPDQALPYRVVVWERGELARSKPAETSAEAQRMLIRLLTEARDFRT